MIIHSLVLISQLFFYPLVNCDWGFAMDFGFPSLSVDYY